MYDCYNRTINYLRVSITDRCNLRCTYCMPEEGIALLPRKQILSFDEIVDTVKYGVDHGINKVRITGGEPLVRKDAVKLVEMIGRINGITDLAMTTNGTLLPQYARALADAGLMRVNISLDSLNEANFRKITRTGELKQVLQGIEAAQKAGLKPIKLNCVIQKSVDEPDAVEVAEYARSLRIEVRFIRQMNLKTGEFYPVHGGTGGECAICNRLRLTADGFLKPCLFGDIKFNIRELGIEKAYQLALNKKPAKGITNNENGFYNIGG